MRELPSEEMQRFAGPRGFKTPNDMAARRQSDEAYSPAHTKGFGGNIRLRNAK